MTSETKHQGNELPLPHSVGGVVLSAFKSGQPVSLAAAAALVDETESPSQPESDVTTKQPVAAAAVASAAATGSGGSGPLSFGLPPPVVADAGVVKKPTKGERRRKFEMKTAVHSKAAIAKRNKFDWALPELWSVSGVVVLIVSLHLLWWSGSEFLTASTSWWLRTVFMVVGIPLLTTVPSAAAAKARALQAAAECVQRKQRAAAAAAAAAGEPTKAATSDATTTSDVTVVGGGNAIVASAPATTTATASLGPQDTKDQPAPIAQRSATTTTRCQRRFERLLARIGLLFVLDNLDKYWRVIVVNLLGVPYAALVEPRSVQGLEQQEEYKGHTPQQRTHAILSSGFWFLCLLALFGPSLPTASVSTMGLLMGGRAMTAVICLQDEFGKQRNFVRNANAAMAFVVWTGIWCSIVTPTLGLVVGMGLCALWYTLPCPFTFFHSIVLLELVKTTLLQLDSVSSWVLALNGQHVDLLHSGMFWTILWVDLTLFGCCLCLGRTPGVLGQDALKALNNSRVQALRVLIYSFPFLSVYSQHWILSWSVFFGSFLLSLIPFYTVEMSGYIENLLGKLKRQSATEMWPTVEGELNKVLSVVKVTEM